MCMRKIIVDGSNTFDNYELFSSKLHSVINGGNVELVCLEENTGVSAMCRLYGELHRIPIMLIPARDELSGKAKYMARNRDMVSYGDELVIFNNGKDRRIGHLLNEAWSLRMKTHVFSM